MEKKLRSFEGCAELIEHWRRIWRKARMYEEEYDYNLSIEMPTIWVVNRFTGIREMIIGYGAGMVILPTGKLIMQDLKEDYTFLDGSPCGVLE